MRRKRLREEGVNEERGEKSRKKQEKTIGKNIRK